MKDKELEAIQEMLDRSLSWVKTAQAAYEEDNLDRCLASAVVSLGLSNVATMQYIQHRDGEPFNHNKHMLDLGIEIGKELAKQEKKMNEGG